MSSNPLEPSSPAASAQDGVSIQPPQANRKKDSTNELPMFDLDEALNFVSTVHEKALETVQMPQVAKGMGYTNPSSTPFYRRTTAARLFGLLSNTRAELTLRAKEYLKPTSENARIQALIDSINGIPYYQSEVQKHLGKRLNVHFVANSFAKELNLSDACAQTCAKAFESSLKTAGFLTADGTIQMPSPGSALPLARDEPVQIDSEDGKPATKPHTLHLNKDGTRIITITAPLDLSPKEIKRIQAWLKVTFLMDWDDEDDVSEP